jgi:hypothetical protein
MVRPHTELEAHRDQTAGSRETADQPNWDVELCSFAFHPAADTTRGPSEQVLNILLTDRIRQGGGTGLEVGGLLERVPRV